MYELHHITQVVMGWTNSHLYQFNVGNELLADTRLIDEEMEPITDVKEVMVTQVFTKVGTTVNYEHEFGNGWMHHFELVEISTLPIDEFLTQIIEGEKACPPEDCGGPYEIKELKEILMNPEHPEYKSNK
jgi:hypothetical protein